MQINRGKAMSAISVSFIQNGETKVISSETGITLMELAKQHGIDAIAAECGGACVCATCHCILHDDWADLLPQPLPDEDMALEFNVDNRTQNSRLACQIILTDELDGLVINIP